MELKIFKGGRGTKPRVPLLKKLFWAYFLLLLFEGALRKWIFPHFSAELLLIRDPVAVWIIWEAYRTHKWPRNWSAVLGVLSLGLVGLCAIQMVIDNNPLYVAIYGLRSYLLPFPVAFIMGENLDKEDLRKFAIATLWILIPMTALEAVQYVSPPSARVNAGAYTGAAQIDYVAGHVRASGTFSYDVGPVDLVPLAAAFMLYGLVNEKFTKKWLLWASGVAIVLSIPTIGARTLVLELAGVLGCVVIAASLGVSQLAKSLKIIFPVLGVCLLASFLPVFSDAMGTLNTRFSQASQSEGTAQNVLVDRLLDPLTGNIENVDFSQNWIGRGVGTGAAAVVVLMHGRPSFVAGEGASSRYIYEMGPYTGSAYLLFCYVLGLAIFGKALRCARHHEPLALLLTPAMLATLYMGVFEQPTEQGFMVISVAFSLAAIRAVKPAVRVIPSPANQWAGLAAARLRRQQLLAPRRAGENDPSPSV